MQTYQRAKSMFWSIILIFGGLYLAFMILLYIFQARLIYFPIKSLAASPTHLGLVYEEVWLETEDGLRLHGWFIPAESALRTVLFFHGNAGNISHRLESIEQFHRLGLNVFIIDYRGYGQSEGTPSELGTYRDGEAAWHYLVDQRQIPPEQIVIFGRSLGGGVGAWLAQKYQPGALILESTFASVPAVAAKHYPFIPVRLLARIHYNTLERIPEVNCPVLVIHSPDDEIIPYSNGESIFKAALPPKEFLQIKGGHNEGFLISQAKYEAGLRDFIKRHLDGAK